MAASDTTAETVATEAVPHDLSAEKMMQDNLLILGLLFFIFYFILIRPQQKRIKAHQKMIKSLVKGERVVTAGGLMGTIVKFEGDDVIIVEIAPDVKVHVTRAAITEVVTG